MISVENLNKSFGKNHVLKDVNLEIKQGEVVSLLGPSGSGKTTVLRCLNFLEKSDKGILTIDGERIDLRNVKNNKIREIRSNTGFVFQNFNLFNNKTTLENVTVGLTVARGMNKENANQIGKQLLDKVGLENKYDYYPNQLSGGQQQRVAIARALASKPKIIYFDEPTSALDPELINEVLVVIKQLASDGMTMLVVTHEMNFARNISDRILFIDDGSIIENCTPNEFFNNQKNERINSFINNILIRGE